MYSKLLLTGFQEVTTNKLLASSGTQEYSCITIYYSYFKHRAMWSVKKSAYVQVFIGQRLKIY